MEFRAFCGVFRQRTPGKICGLFPTGPAAGIVQYSDLVFRRENSSAGRETLPVLQKPCRSASHPGQTEPVTGPDYRISASSCRVPAARKVGMKCDRAGTVAGHEHCRFGYVLPDRGTPPRNEEMHRIHCSFLPCLPENAAGFQKKIREKSGTIFSIADTSGNVIPSGSLPNHSGPSPKTCHDYW
jgi:hypothetical protein